MLVKLQVAQNPALSWKSLGVAVRPAQLVTSHNQVFYLSIRLSSRARCSIAGPTCTFAWEAGRTTGSIESANLRDLQLRSPRLLVKTLAELRDVCTDQQDKEPHEQLVVDRDMVSRLGLDV
jgi:hypothetical protein